MANIFFASDHHFDHANIIRLANRPFSSVEEMNETIIERHNAVVRDEDTAYFLGDFCWADGFQHFRRMRGKKVLILGNHDQNSLQLGWEYIATEKTLPIGKKKILLYHYPIEDWNGRFKGVIHLHGHIHSLQWKTTAPSVTAQIAANHPLQVDPSMLKITNKKNRFDVGVEGIDYTPVSVEDVLKRSS